MLSLLLSWFIGALSLMIVAYVIPGFTVTSFGAALIAALVIGLVNATLGLLLKVLTFPLSLLTFGLFLFVINALMLRLAASLVSGFAIDGFLPALLGAIVLSLVHSFLRQIVFGVTRAAMPTYAGSSTVREARARYFAENGFGEGGYEARWVKLQAGPMPLFLPNTAERVRSVRFHDLHHVLTDYETTWLGEAEIAAWEIASSCADHYAAWFLNLSGLGIGLFIDPARVFRAFVRGRHSANLYRREFGDALLAPTVSALRGELALDRPIPPARAVDRIAFAAWAAAGLLTLVLPAFLLLALLAAIALLLR